MKEKLGTYLIIMSMLFFNHNCDGNKSPSGPSEGSSIKENTVSKDIDPSGGIVSITEESHALNNAFVDIPTDALKEKTKISIRPVNNNKEFSIDPAITYVEFGPKGTQFERPIKVGIPYNKDEFVKTDNLTVFVFDESDQIWTPLPVIEVDASKGLVIAEANHFSFFKVDDDYILFWSELYNFQGKIAVNVKLLTPLSEVRLPFFNAFASDAYSIKDYIIKNGSDLRVTYKAQLKEKRLLPFSPTIDTRSIRYTPEPAIDDIPSRIGYDRFGIKRYDVSNEKSIFSPEQTFGIDLLENQLSGEAVLLVFDETTPSPNTEYYADIKIIFSTRKNNRLVGFSFSTINEPHAFSSLSPAPDRDFDLVINDYDPITGQPPSRVEIQRPTKTTFTEGDRIQFAGVAIDPEDGILRGRALKWTSDRFEEDIGLGEVTSSIILEPGTHTITLTATDSDGNSIYDKISVTVLGKAPLIADAGPNLNVHMFDTVTLNGLNSQGENLRYEWKIVSNPGSIPQFSRNNSSSARQTTFTPGRPGEYVIELVVTNGQERSAPDRTTITVINDPPRASFTISPGSNVGTATTLSFNAAGSTDQEDTNNDLQYRWRWERGALWTQWSNEAIEQHKYATGGTKQVTLEIRDRGGLTSSVTKEITITQSIAEIISIEPSGNDGQYWILVSDFGRDDIAEVQLFIDDSNAFEMTGTRSGDWKFLWNTKNYTPGEYEIQIEIFDDTSTSLGEVEYTISNESDQISFSSGVSPRLENQSSNDGNIQSEINPANELIVTLPGGANMELIWVEPGKFTMGMTEEAEIILRSKGLWNDGFESEKPARVKTISKGFYLGKYEITQEQWESVMEFNPSLNQYSLSSHTDSPCNSNTLDLYLIERCKSPVEFFSRDHVREFIKRLNDDIGEEIYRLPTETEWEFACRAGTTALWFFGDNENLLGDYAWYSGNVSRGSFYKTNTVGTKLPNPWGFYDLYGNVWELCYESFNQNNDTVLLDLSSNLMVKGGSFSSGPQFTRSAYRTMAGPHPDPRTGMRIVRVK